MSEPALLMTAKTNFEGKVIVSVLAGAGIEAFHATGNLMDEFSVAQSLMNLQGVDVYVKSDAVEAAKRVLEDARSAGRFLEGDAE